MKIKNLSGNFWFSYIICAFCYGVINFIFLPHNHLIGFPVSIDDYNTLAFNVSALTWDTPRPIIYFLAAFLSYLGGTGYYFLILFLVIFCAVAVFRFVQYFFARTLPVEWLILYGALVFSFPFIIEVSKFLGIIINICSALFALASLYFLLKGYRENKNQFFILACIFYTLSLFTKEDFILPNIILIFYLFFFEKTEFNQQYRKIKLSLFLLYIIIAIVGLAVFNQYIVHSTYTSDMMSSMPAAYVINLKISSIFDLYLHYLTSNIYTIILSMSSLIIFILSVFFTEAKTSIRISFLLLLILSLIMPYSVLPNHTGYFYIYNWLPWESAVIIFGLFLLCDRWNRKTKYIFVGVISALLMLITYPHRNYTCIKYNESAQKNKNMVSTLLSYKEDLNCQSYVGITNVTGFAPWLSGDGDYFHDNLGLKPKWIVFVDKNSTYIKPFDSSRQINVLSKERICDFSPMKYLYFMPDGKGKLSSSCHK